jgi:hypothetical protein
MALRRKGKFTYGDSQLDIREVLSGYSDRNYPAEHYRDAVCSCGGKVFRLLLDDVEGAAVRICKACGDEHPIGDSADYIEEATLGECECPCGSGLFEITAGVALYEGSEDVKWLYLGCRCLGCGLTACYGDWKNEYIGYQEFLSRI